MLLHILFIIAGIAGLGFAGDKLVDVAAAIARRLRMSPAVIGLTIVAAGTSFPELMVSLNAALGGSPDIAVGNVVGSNISNTTLILGFVALLAPIPVARSLMRFEYPFMMLSIGVLLLLSRDGTLDRLECGFLAAAMVCFTAWTVWAARRAVSTEEKAELAEQVPPEAEPLSRRPAWVLVAGLVAAFVALSVSANLLVDGAVGIARTFGITERVIGLTIVAIGTSLPELVASLLAARRGQHEMAVTNIVGSNVFNTLMILGVTGLVKPIPVAPSIAGFDMWVMVGMGALLWALTVRRGSLSRVGGGVLLAAFGTYTVILLG